MAPWMVPRTTSWGVRRYFSRPRLAMPSVLTRRPAALAVGAAMDAIGALLSVSGRRAAGGLGPVVEGLAGQRQEDLVEGRGTEGDVVDGGAGRLERPQRVPELLGAGLDADADAAGGPPPPGGGGGGGGPGARRPGWRPGRACVASRPSRSAPAGRRRRTGRAGRAPWRCWPAPCGRPGR